MFAQAIKKSATTHITKRVQQSMVTRFSSFNNNETLSQAIEQPAKNLHIQATPMHLANTTKNSSAFSLKQVQAAGFSMESALPNSNKRTAVGVAVCSAFIAILLSLYVKEDKKSVHASEIEEGFNALREQGGDKYAYYYMQDFFALSAEVLATMPAAFQSFHAEHKDTFHSLKNELVSYSSSNEATEAPLMDVIVDTARAMRDYINTPRVNMNSLQLLASATDLVDPEAEDVDDDEDEGETTVTDPNTNTGKVYVSTSTDSDIRIFTGNGNPLLAHEVCSTLNVQMGRAKVQQYADGEVSVQILDSVRGKDCYVMQSLCGPNPHDQLVELLLLISSLRRANAERIVAVIPYYAYSRQLDNSLKDKPMIGAADIAIMLESVGVDHVVAVDLHRPQVIGFFDKVVCENIDTQEAALPYLKEKIGGRKVTVVAPVGAAVKRALKFHNALKREGIDTAMALSYLTKSGVVDMDDDQHHVEVDKSRDVIQIQGDYKGRDVIIVDDIIDSASRCVNVSEQLKKGGAKRIYAFATHGFLSGSAVDRIEKSPISEVVIFDTIPLPVSKQSANIRQLSVSGLLAQTIKSIHKNKAIHNVHHVYGDDIFQH